MNAPTGSPFPRFPRLLFLAALLFAAFGPAAQAARVGLFLGSFDPPHAGIARMIGEARDRLRLESVFVLPVPEPVGRASVAPLRDRLAMLRLIGKEIPGFATLTEADLVAIASRRPENLFAALREDMALRRPDDEFFQIVGEDALAKLIAQRQLPTPDERRTLVVFPRQGVPTVRHPCLDKLEQRRQMIRLTVEIPDISGHELRLLLGDGCRPPDDRLPGVVHQYIRREGLYGMAPCSLTREEIDRFAPAGYLAKPVLLHGPTTDTSFVPAHAESLLGENATVAPETLRETVSEVPVALDELLEKGPFQVTVFQAPTTDSLDWLQTQGWRTFYGFVPPEGRDMPMLFFGRRGRDWHLFITGAYAQDRFLRLVRDLSERFRRFAIPTDRLTILVPVRTND